eukprot:m.203503 g.203503  ORF g.203503 m.203503 type:complete len:127 (+) comp39625_c1_seq22:92-472(+)
MSEKMASEHMQKKKSCAHDLAEKIRAKCFKSYYENSEFPEKVIQVVCKSNILPTLLRGELGVNPSSLQTRPTRNNDYEKREDIIQVWIDDDKTSTLEILFEAVESGGQWRTVSESLEATLCSPGTL